MVSSKLLRHMVDFAWDDPSVLTLRQQLRAFEDSNWLPMAGGTFSSTSANGRHVALTSSGPGSVTAVEFVEAWRYLIDTYDRSTSELSLVVDDSVDTVTEAAIKTQMMVNLREVLGYTSNFMYLSK